MKNLMMCFSLLSALYSFSGVRVESWTFASARFPFSAGIGMEMNVVDGKAELSIFKERLFNSGRTKGKTHKELIVRDNSVYFYGVFCGDIEEDGSVKVKIGKTDFLGESQCYLENSDMSSIFKSVKYMIKAEIIE